MKIITYLESRRNEFAFKAYVSACTELAKSINLAWIKHSGTLNTYHETMEIHPSESHYPIEPLSANCNAVPIMIRRIDGKGKVLREIVVVVVVNDDGTCTKILLYGNELNISSLNYQLFGEPIKA